MRYVLGIDQGGTKTFEDLARSAGLPLPYDDGSIRAIGAAVEGWLNEHE